MIKLDRRVSHERLTRICFVDYDSEMVLVAEGQNPETADCELLAVGRLNKAPDANEAEFAMLISDMFQHHGLGTEMLRRLLEFARAEKLDRVTADILFENDHMANICTLLGFRLRYSSKEQVLKAELLLNP